MSSWVVTTPPLTEPVTVAEVNEHLRLTDTTTQQDLLVGEYITAAREFTEDFCGRTLVTTTYDLFLDGFADRDRVVGGVIHVPRPPLQSVTQIQYVDTGGTTQTWLAANYTVDIKSEPGRITPAFDITYPTTRNVVNSVTITYVGGYGAASAVPERYKNAIKIFVGYMFEFRGDDPGSVISEQLPPVYRRILQADRVINI